MPFVTPLGPAWPVKQTVAISAEQKIAQTIELSGCKVFRNSVYDSSTGQYEEADAEDGTVEGG